VWPEKVAHKVSRWTSARRFAAFAVVPFNIAGLYLRLMYFRALVCLPRADSIYHGNTVPLNFTIFVVRERTIRAAVVHKYACRNGLCRQKHF